MTNYAKGARLERELKAMKEAQGMYCVRAAGSHGTFDLVCWAIPNIVELIQCKTRKPTEREISEFHAVRCPLGWAKIWAIRKDRKRWKEMKL